MDRFCNSSQLTKTETNTAAAIATATNTTNEDDDDSELRIACLIPSATIICIELGLISNIVGITHECIEFFNMPPSSYRQPKKLEEVSERTDDQT